MSQDTQIKRIRIRKAGNQEGCTGLNGDQRFYFWIRGLQIQSLSFPNETKPLPLFSYVPAFLIQSLILDSWLSSVIRQPT
ncbi:MAG TPA: hypothetical protein DCG89_10755 [Spartobacteria bacterium]|nr:hypothetical protein [Spartobacteria bacterium]